ncbi:MAG: protoheme IX farnesyltransferase [Flavobacteriaceae bacterium]|nr:protoheme IX farnesyltransferase [Flavobacteriaceae bacterium]
MNPTVKGFAQLAKFRLSCSVAATSVFGYILGCKFNASEPNTWLNVFELHTFIGVVLGGILVVFAANGLNQIVEKENDGKMSRTSNRPIVEERIPLNQAIIVCWITAFLGLGILALTTNSVSVFFAALSLVIYVFIYTPMKQVSNLSVMVGAIPGALPPLIGYTAVVERIDEPGMMLFLVQFFWQFPHFWSIAWMFHEDYQKAGYWMLPSSGGRDKKSALQIVIYTVLLILVSMAPVYYGITGPKSLLFILPMSLFMLFKARALFQSLEVADARKLLLASLLYTPIIFLGYIIF